MSQLEIPAAVTVAARSRLGAAQIAAWIAGQVRVGFPADAAEHEKAHPAGSRPHDARQAAGEFIVTISVERKV